MPGLDNEHEGFLFLLEEIEELRAQIHDHNVGYADVWEDHELLMQRTDRLDKDVTDLKQNRIVGGGHHPFKEVSKAATEDDDAHSIALSTASGSIRSLGGSSYGRRRSVSRSRSMTRNGLSSGNMIRLPSLVGSAPPPLSTIRRPKGDESLDIERLGSIAPIDEDDELNMLPGDVYSFFACVDYFYAGCLPRTSFLLATAIFCIQSMTMALFTVDIINVENSDNPLGVPAGVSNVVRIAQLVALIITAISQDETQLSLNLLARGYDKDALAEFKGDFTPLKWYWSLLARLFIGGVSLAVTFMLVTRSSTVRDLMLDFTAVSFVSQIDNGAFVLAKWGYMGKEARAEAEEVETKPVLFISAESLSNMEDGVYKSILTLPRAFSLLLVLMGLMFFWAWLAIRQINGTYVPETIFVQFGDEFSPTTGMFSGLYEMQVGDFWRGGRGMEYVAVRQVEDQQVRAKFYYCNSEAVWAFYYGVDYSGTGNKVGQSCEYVAKSATTEAFDITATSSDHWYLIDQVSGVDLPFQHFVIEPQNVYFGKSCGNNGDCNSRNFYCGPKLDSTGNPIDNQKVCLCDPGFFGVICEFSTPCDKLEIDARTPLGFLDTRQWSSNFEVVLEEGRDNAPVQVYGKPIYIGDNVRGGIDFDVMLYIGRRWILSHTEDFGLDETLNTPEKIALYLSENYHAYWSDYIFPFISEPVDVGTPINSATPVSLQWFRLDNPDKNQESFSSRPSDASLICATCNNSTNPCFFDSFCGAGGICSCGTGSTGTLCQLAPVGDAKCDDYFNNGEFEYDGGDCCFSTCTANDGTLCGVDDSTSPFGLTLDEFVGFPNCVDPTQLCDTPTCWKEVHVQSATSFFSGMGWSVSLSGNGAVWAASEYETGMVQVYEYNDGTFHLRGTPFTNVSYVESVALSYDGATVGIGSKDGGVRLYSWIHKLGSWAQLGPIVRPDIPVRSISLSYDGLVLAVGYVEKGVEMFFYDYSSFQWQSFEGGQPVESEIERTNFVSLSGDGQRVAVAFPAMSAEDENATLTDLESAHVAVYEYNQTTARWMQLGPNFVNRTHEEEFGLWVSMSSDGRRVASVASFDDRLDGFERFRVISVHEYDSTENVWLPLGQELQDVVEFEGNEPGQTIDLSGDGMVIAIGVMGHSVDVSSPAGGSVIFFDYDQVTETWVRRETDVHDNGGSTSRYIPSVSLSFNGGMVAIGDPFDRFGNVRVFRNPELSAVVKITPNVPSLGLVRLHMRIQLDSVPEETVVYLKCGDVTFGNGQLGRFYTENQYGAGAVFVENGADCEFVIGDSGGNGLCCDFGDGFYEIYYEFTESSNLIASGDGVTFGSYERVLFKASPPVDLIPVILQLDVVGRYLYAEDIALHFACENAVESVAPPGAFDSRSGFSGLQGVKLESYTSRFLLPADVECEFQITKVGALSGDSEGNWCESCSVIYKIFQEDTTRSGEQILLAGQNASQYIMSPTDRVTWKVLAPNNAIETVVPITVVLDLDDAPEETGFELNCGKYLQTGFPVGYLSSETLPTSTYKETFYVPEGTVCELSVIDSGGDGLCCEKGSGSYQIYFSDMDTLNSQNLIHKGSKIEARQALVFKASTPSDLASPLTLAVQLDESPDENGFMLDCLEDGLAVEVDFESYDFDGRERLTFVFLIQDMPSCSIVFFDKMGDGLAGGFYAVYNETHVFVDSGRFDDFNQTHNLLQPAQLAPITFVLHPDQVNREFQFEMTCGSFSENGTVTGYSESTGEVEITTRTFYVVEGAHCVFSIWDKAGNGLCCENGRGRYELYYADEDGLINENLIYSGGEFDNSESVIFEVTAPSDATIDVSVVLEIGVDIPAEPFHIRCPSGRDMYVDFGLFNFSGGEFAREVFVYPDILDCTLEFVECCGNVYEVNYGQERHIQTIMSSSQNATLVNISDFIGGVPITFVLSPGKEAGEADYNFVIDCGPTVQVDTRNQLFRRWDSTNATTETFWLDEGTNCRFVAYEVWLGGFYEIYYGNDVTAEDALIWRGIDVNTTDVIFFDAEFPSPTLVPLIFEWILDAYPFETSFALDCTNSYNVSYGLMSVGISYFGTGDVIFFIPNNTDCQVTGYDSYGDGIFDGGYYVLIGDEVVLDVHFGTTDVWSSQTDDIYVVQYS